MAFATKGSLLDLQRQDEKELAIAYLDKNNVSTEIEALLNRLCLDRPNDFYGHMAAHFSEMAFSPVISRLSGRTTYTGTFTKAEAVDLFCTVHGKEKLAAHVTLPLEPALDQPDPSLSPPASEKGGQDEKVFRALTAALQGMDPGDQKQLDGRILETGVGTMGHTLSASFACAMAAATFQGTDPILHLGRHYHGKGCKLGLPYLVCPVISSGLHGVGKLRLAQFSVCPLQPSSLSDHVAVLSSFHAHLRSLLKERFGAAGRLAGDWGHCPALDKIEQPFELLSDAASASGLQLGKDIGIIVNVGAQAMYNADKEKYELTAGQPLKTVEELLAQLEALVTKQEGLVGLVDPFITKDLGAWQKLYSMVGQSCYIMTDQRELLSQQTGEEAVNCIIAAPQQTVSQTLQHYGDLQLSSPAVCTAMTVSNSTTPDAMQVLANLVTLTGCRFVMLPYFKDLTSVFVSHLLKIKCILDTARMYVVYKQCSLTSKEEDSNC